MDLTDHQWALIQPLISGAFVGSPSLASDRNHKGAARSRGRPPIDDRAVLNGILFKIRTATPWYHLPNRYPSHQTCYRRFSQWRRSGLLAQIFLLLFDHLVQHGDIDPRQALEAGTIIVIPDGAHCRVLASPDLQDTWQLSTAQVFIQLAYTHHRSTQQVAA